MQNKKLQTKPEIRERDAAAWEAWKVSPCEFAFPNGHAPLQDLYARAGTEWAHLRDSSAPGTTTLVVAHGAFNRVFLAQALGLPIEAFMDDSFDFVNCECVEFEWSDTERSFRWRRRHPVPSAWRTLDEEQRRFAALQEGGPIASKQYAEPGSSKGS
jgi:broad specificity phosphatase PhoE